MGGREGGREGGSDGGRDGGREGREKETMTYDLASSLHIV